MTSAGRTRGERSNRRRSGRHHESRSRKATEIVALVEALTSEHGKVDGAVLGRGIASLIADAYRARQEPIPLWVGDLIAHYGCTER